MSTKKILVTGPESTGKTALCAYLADYYEGQWIPEYARSYIEQLDRPYLKEDVLEIGKQQLKQWNTDYNSCNWVFFDTGLMITKVWLELVYHETPPWIENALRASKPDLALLCYPDLEWKPDPVRENGGQMRLRLFETYIENLRQFGYAYEIVKGESVGRYNNAVQLINKYFNT